MSDWLPSDSWVEGLVRRVRGLPLNVPIHPETVRAWKRAVLREIDRRRELEDQERKQDPEDEARPRSRSSAPRAEDVSAVEIVREMMASPYTAMFLDLCVAMPRVLASVQEAARRRHREEGGFLPGVKHEAKPIADYLRYKLRGAQPGERPLAVHVAAVNAVTPARARSWEDALSGTSEATMRAALMEMDDIGRRASAASAPLKLWYPEPGPPRGIWPDPPPPDDPTPEQQGAGAAPPFIPGRRG